MTAHLRRLAELTRGESLSLLAGVAYGRVVFTARALPAIRPVNHVVDDGDVIIRTHLGTALGCAAEDRMVVAYEADAIDPVARVGWSVVVTGVARLITDQHDLARYERLLQPWVDQPIDHTVRISADLVTGFRLVDGANPPPHRPAP
jgi:hypothetical protein